MRLDTIIEASARRVPERVALRTREQDLSYADLWDAVETVANGLAHYGLARHERIAVYLPKQVEAVVAMFAASRAGAVFVPINPVLKAAQVKHILKDCGARMLVTNASRLAAIAEDLADCQDLTHIIVTDDADSVEVSSAARLNWRELPGAAEVPLPSSVDADMVAILYTSGSTGRPKGVVLSHRNMVAGAESVAAYLENDESDCLLAALPLSFDYGFSQLTTAFLVGASVALMDYLLPRDVLAAAERFEVTALAAVPPLWTQLAGLSWPPPVVERLRYITNSGGAIPQATLKQLRHSLPSTKVFLMYGLTEAFRSTFLPPEQVDTRPTSMGKAIPNAEVLVLRPDGSECGAWEPGELVHRGAHVALGYWNDAERTAQRFRPMRSQATALPIPELAVWSGDTVQKDEEGYLYFVARRDEMIKTSGYRVSPTEIEEAIYESGVVGEAVALGAPHPVLGQAIVVVAVPSGKERGSTDALLATCRRLLPTYMLPGRVEWVASLPRNPNGKIDRKALAERFACLFEDAAL